MPIRPSTPARRLVGLLTVALLGAWGLAACATPPGAPPDAPLLPDAPLVIAHRGASGTLTEHSLAAYTLAHAQGAGALEPDVVMTADGVLLCSHDRRVPTDSDVAARFPGRARADGRWWFADLTQDEVRAIRRADGDRFPTLDEMLTLTRRLDAAAGRRVFVVPELKHPAFHRAEGLAMEAPLLELLARHGFRARDDAAIVQCFDEATLHALRHEHGTDLRLVMLVDAPVTPTDLDRWATFCDGIGPWRQLIEPDATDGRAPVFGPGHVPPAELVRRAHARGLFVTPWTFKADIDDTLRFLGLHRVDGLFTDFPGEVVRGLQARAAR